MKKTSKTDQRPQRSPTAFPRLGNEFLPDIPNSALCESDLPSSEADLDYARNKFFRDSNRNHHKPYHAE